MQQWVNLEFMHEAIEWTIPEIDLGKTKTKSRPYYMQPDKAICLRNIVKYGKDSLAKFANFVYICLTCGKALSLSM